MGVFGGREFSQGEFRSSDDPGARSFSTRLRSEFGHRVTFAARAGAPAAAGFLSLSIR